ncbi:hypothetical protein ACP70R_012041 [Stipagrostis hirtigluma subsp. patula]
MSEGSMRRRPSSPPAAPLPDDDDLLREFLLRLPPLPSSLPGASLVCRRWRRLVSDPQFLRRFRAFHHRNPTLLGFFVEDITRLAFVPTLDPPEHIPSSRLSLPQPRDELWSFLGCRHGLALLLNRTRLEMTVWDPVTGDQRRVAVPPGFNNESPIIAWHGALLCDDGHAGCHYSKPFKVVLLGCDNVLPHADRQVCASLYDSQTGVWSDLISTSIIGLICPSKPGILVENSLYWSVLGNHENGATLEYDLDRQILAMIDHPVDAHVTPYSKFQILRMEDRGLGLAILSDGSIQLWEKKANSDGGARWMLQKTIELHMLLSLSSPLKSSCILGYDEDGHVIFLWTVIGVIMIQLKSMQFRNLFKTNIIPTYYPYSSFYTAVGDSGAETLNYTWMVVLGSVELLYFLASRCCVSIGSSPIPLDWQVRGVV